MRFAFAALSFACLTLYAALSPAAAQTPELRDAAASMIARANADGVFAIEDGGALILVRHAGSGMACRFDPAHDSALTIFPEAASGSRFGEDVGCNTNTPTDFRTFYATRYGRVRNVDEALDYAVRQIANRFPDAREAPSADMPAPDQPLPDSRTAAFIVQTPDGELYTRVSVAVLDGWEFKMRYSTFDLTQIATGEMLWRALLADVLANAAARGL